LIDFRIFLWFGARWWSWWKEKKRDIDIQVSRKGL
jgi:hypothetical protein